MRLRTRLLIFTCSLVILTLIAFALLTGWTLRGQLLDQARAQIVGELEQRAAPFSALVDDAGADVLALAADPDTQALIADPAAEALRQRIARRFLAQLAQRPQYLQLRIISAGDGGRELVRVDRQGPGDGLREVAGPQLQSKGESSYFLGAIGTAPGGLYVSPLDLNREFGTIQQPKMPVLRIATTLYTTRGDVFGTLIANLDMRPALTALASGPQARGEVLLVDKKGRFLLHPDAGKAFAFEFGPAPTIGDLYPGLGALPDASNPSSVTLDVSGTPDIAVAVPVDLNGEHRLTLVELVEENQILSPFAPLLRTLAVMAALVLAAAIPASAILADSLTRPLNRLSAAVVARSMRGNAHVIERTDEIGALARAFDHFLQRERLFTAAVEKSPVAVLTADTEGNITSWNAGAAALYGYSAEAAMGMKVAALVPDHRREEYEQARHRINEGEAVRFPMTERLTRSGEIVQVELSASPLMSPEGAVDGVAKIAIDVTERYLAEERFQLAVAASPAALIMFQAGGRITLANPAAEQIFGFAPGSMAGEPIGGLLPNSVSTGLTIHSSDGDAHSAATSAHGGIEVSARRHSGERFPAEISFNPITTRDGPAVLAVIVDVTERRAMETKLAEYTAELERSNAELEQFAYLASHDLQEPLRMVSSFCDLLDKRYGGQLGPEGQQFLAYAVDGAQRMRQLINDLLDYARLQSVPMPAGATSGQAALRQATANLQMLIDETGAEIDAADLPDLRIDASLLTSLLQNLLGNALKFRAEQPPRIGISWSEHEGMAQISVRDNGIGIPEQHRERVFGIFQRLHARTDYPGTGMGLAACRKIVERVGGRIWIEQSDGQGTVFTFTVPLAREEDDESVKAHASG